MRRLNTDHFYDPPEDQEQQAASAFPESDLDGPATDDPAPDYPVLTDCPDCGGHVDHCGCFEASS